MMGEGNLGCLCRLVAMASLFEQLGKVRWDDLEGYTTHDSSLFEYSNSKLMVIMMARELNKRLKVSVEADRCAADRRSADCDHHCSIHYLPSAHPFRSKTLGIGSKPGGLLS